MYRLFSHHSWHPERSKQQSSVLTGDSAVKTQKTLYFRFKVARERELKRI